MKSLFLVLLAAVGAPAAEFSTGQAARLVIGQRTFTEQLAGAGQDLVGGVSGLAYGNDSLFVVDSNRIGASPQNERVLIFKNLSSTLPRPTDELGYDRPCPACRGAADVVLGQANFSTTDIALTQKGLRTPTSVATDGVRVVVSDTDNNRVLIWNRIPTANGTPADVVVGQPDFTKASIPTGNVPNNKSMRGPQGVWIQNGRLFVADTQNHRILIYNSIPTANGAAADVVLGQKDFNSFVEPDLTRASADTSATNLINPVSVSSDGVRLYVADLGHNRVLIWNSIPSSNQAAADISLGQPDMAGATANNSPKVCASDGTDADGKATYPKSCLATMDFPRFALSDGQKLFIADGGNDRVLIYNHIPTKSGEAADVVIGQLGGGINQASDSTDSMRTPMSLAWDGTNLYVSDSFNRRVMVYSVADRNVPYAGVRNSASREVFAVGSVTISGTIKENDELTLKIVGTEYKYKVLKDDTHTTIIRALVSLLNSSNDGKGDPNVLGIGNTATDTLVLTARKGGAEGNDVTFGVSASDNATLLFTTSGASLTGGQDAAKIAPGTIVSIFAADGAILSEQTASANPQAQTLPTTLGNTQVYFDGIRAPLVFVSPAEVRAQVPFEVQDRTSINAYVRNVRQDGRVVVTTPVAVTIVLQNPGIFAAEGSDPRRAIALHGSAQASGTVSVDGSIFATDVAKVLIEDREYGYTIVAGDTLVTVRDHLIDLINQDPKVYAFAAGSFTRIRLRARVPGPEGNKIAFSGKSNDGSQVIVTALNTTLCCANTGLVTDDNPAVAGETIIVYATGLGVPQPRVEATGIRYNGPITDPCDALVSGCDGFVSSLAGGKTANVLLATMKAGEVGIYEVHLELNSGLTTDPLTQLTIAQFVFVSNIVTVPVVNPAPK